MNARRGTRTSRVELLMFKPTDWQTRIFGADARLGDSGRRRLRESWAEGFRRQVVPLLLEAESDFSDFYDGATGADVGASRTSWGCVFSKKCRGSTTRLHSIA
ncbi:MAG: hypothetical protein ACJAYU_001355 [Bradymonadia bacterium]|jgi:hypothetical protein